jgi:uncharacterized damage-inducible protein DinB
MSEPTLSRLFEINHYAITVNTEGISEEESRIQPKPNGNCMNWVVGHIVSSREAILKLVGAESALPKDVAERYKRGSAPVTGSGDGATLAQLLQHLGESQERLLRGIENASEEKWNEAVPEWGTARHAAHFLHFHEAYHAGQLAVLRRMAGKKGAIQ